MAQTITLAEYLFTRLLQLGVQSMHGVPGDYNLKLLDYVEPAGLRWVGNCNELNAGYAADGYARIKGLGALITTFGVGELSAINAIAGAYAERAAVVHIVGTPDRALQDSRALVHHTFNDGEYRKFGQMHAHVTVAQASLRDPRTSPAQIDAVLEQCLLHSRPVYIEFPVDMVGIPISSARLTSPISIPETLSPPSEAPALSLVLDKIQNAKRPVILVDGEIRAYGMVDEIHKLLTTTKWPAWATAFSKGLIDETLQNFHGVYAGTFKPEQKDFIDASDLILCFGPHYSNTNTYGYTAIPNPAVTVSVGANIVQCGTAIFYDLPAKYFLSRLLEKLSQIKMPEYTSFEIPESLGNIANSSTQLSASGPITQFDFYTRMSPFFRSGDIILTETGTAGYGGRDFILPPQTRLFGPVTWLSIGYMLPATLGAALAQRDRITHEKADPSKNRTILFIGDGSLQMTVQEISTIIHEKLDVIIFILNNQGYTIERCIHGRAQRYNDVAAWRYLQAPSFFGAAEGDDASCTFTVNTWGDLDRVLDDERIKNGKGLRLVEIFMDRDDAPVPLLALLKKQLDAEKKENSS